MSSPPDRPAGSGSRSAFMIEDAAALLAAIVASSNDAILSKTLDGTITSWNGATERLFGYSGEEIIGRSIRLLIPDDRQHEEDYILTQIAQGNRVENYETVRIRKDGTLIDVSVTISPVRDRSGNIIGASKIVRDISDRIQSEARIRQLLSEVNHRSKNLLGVIQAIARQTAQAHPDDFLPRFDARLKALATNQDLLIHNGWRGIPIAALMEAQVAPFADPTRTRIAHNCADLMLRGDAAQQIGMAIHELATNAVKYGALSNNGGTVDIDCTVADDTLTLRWTERGGPAVAPPQDNHFGSRLLTRLMPGAVDGEAALTFAESGVEWRLVAPLDAIKAEPGDDR